MRAVLERATDKQGIHVTGRADDTQFPPIPDSESLRVRVPFVA